MPGGCCYTCCGQTAPAGCPPRHARCCGRRRRLVLSATLRLCHRSQMMKAMEHRAAEHRSGHSRHISNDMHAAPLHTHRQRFLLCTRLETKHCVHEVHSSLRRFHWASLFAQEQREAFLGVSKKDAGLRRRELLGAGTGSLAEALCRTCQQSARQLLRSKAAGDLLVEVRSKCLAIVIATATPMTIASGKCPPALGVCCAAALQVVMGGSNGILQELAPAELASLRDTVVSLAAEPRSTPGDLSYNS